MWYISNLYNAVCQLYLNKTWEKCGTGHKDRLTNQWNRIKSPKRNPYSNGQLIFNKRAKAIQWGKNSFFNKWCWKNRTSTFKRMNLDAYLKPYTKQILTNLNF